MDRNSLGHWMLRTCVWKYWHRHRGRQVGAGRHDVELLETRVFPAGTPGFVFDNESESVTEGRSNVSTLRFRLSEPSPADLEVTVTIAGDSDLKLGITRFTVRADASSDPSQPSYEFHWSRYRIITVSADEDSDTLNGSATVRLDATGHLSASAELVELDNDKPLAIEFERDQFGAEILAYPVVEGHSVSSMVRLSAAPSATVTLTPSQVGGDAFAYVADGNELRFNRDNWDVFQYVVYVAEPDARPGAGSVFFKLEPSGADVLSSRTVRVDVQRVDSTSTTNATVVVDDYSAQPLVGEQQAGQSVAFYSNLGADRGVIASGATGRVVFGTGEVRAEVVGGVGFDFAGVFHALRNIQRENLTLNLHSLFPAAIRSEYQRSATAIVFEIEDGTGEFKVEVKSPTTPTETTLFVSSTALTGGRRTLRVPLPATGLESAALLVWNVVGSPGAFARVSKLSLETTGRELGALEPVVWSYANLLANYDPTSGLTRDRSNFPAGDFDNVSATGLQALAATVMRKLGVIDQASAIEIVSKSTQAVLALPRHRGVLPHFTQRATGVGNTIKPGTEYGSLDAVIALTGLLLANQSLGLAATSEIEASLKGMDWEDLRLPNGTLSHGYGPAKDINGNPILDGNGQPVYQRLASGWDTFGGEKTLIEFGFAASRPGAPLPGATNPNPPTFDGSGFIDELAELILPGLRTDRFGSDVAGYRAEALDRQLTRLPAPASPLLGLSAVEVSKPHAVGIGQVYNAFGVGGIAAAKDGRELLGRPIATGHYLAMTASHAPLAFQAAWDDGKRLGVVSPLNVLESVHIEVRTGRREAVANPFKGSLNLAFVVLGAGKGLLNRFEKTPDEYPPYAAAAANVFTAEGLARLGESSVPVPASTAVRFHRLFNITANTHFFTSNQAEAEFAIRAGLRDETTGRAGISVATTSAADRTPLYRLYNLQTGTHYYTTNAAERESLVALVPPPPGPDTRTSGWRFEGEVGFVFPNATANTALVQRLYNTASGTHLFTENASVATSVLLLPGWERHSPLAYFFTAIPEDTIGPMRWNRIAKSLMNGLAAPSVSASEAANQGFRHFTLVASVDSHVASPRPAPIFGLAETRLRTLPPQRDASQIVVSDAPGRIRKGGGSVSENETGMGNFIANTHDARLLDRAIREFVEGGF